MTVNGTDGVGLGDRMIGFADVRIEYIEDRSLLALQGPKAATILQSLLAGGPSASIDVSKIDFMYHTPNLTVGGISDCLVTRCGYTGEDGFEISVPNATAVKLMEKLLSVQVSTTHMCQHTCVNTNTNTRE